MDWRTVEKVPSTLPLPELFRSLMGRGAAVLDVGCGEAGISRDVQASGARYLGVDINLPSLRRASARGLRVAAGEARALPVRRGCVDLVMLRAVLTVIPVDAALEHVLSEAFRASRELVGVQDFLQTWEQPLYAARYEEGLGLGRPRGVFPVRQGGGLLYWARHFTPQVLEELVARAGGVVETLQEHPAPTRSGNIIRGVTLLTRAR